MSQQDNFSGGFLLGTIVGGVVGGLVGALLASGKLAEKLGELTGEEEAGGENGVGKGALRRSLRSANGHRDMESSRRSLEDKIAQLNDAIDDVRQQLGGVNGVPAKKSEGDRVP